MILGDLGKNQWGHSLEIKGCAAEQGRYFQRVVAIGYGDGYPRHIDIHASVSVNKQRAAIVGRISMDLMTIDLRNIQAAVGDEVVLWGPEIPVDDIAASAETIAYELTSGVYGRVKYRYID